MILIKSLREIEIMRVAGRKTARVMAALAPLMRSGITPLEIDLKAAQVISEEGAKPAFKGYMGYPAHICVSVNEAVVHGIPGHRPLREEDIVGIDLGVVWDGFYGDMARTFVIGHVDSSVEKLLSVTEEAMWKGIEKCVFGNRVGDISSAVEQWVVQHNFSVVRDLVGHGIGTKLHEDPAVPNFGRPNTGPKLEVGMVLAIEPMVNQGTSDVRTLTDGWTVVTKDGKLSAHFENTVAVTEKGPEVLTKL
ncbi:MAG: type I methionyl aminopeptidase [Chlamydiae bacterium]|nr:type I methionyl aminopeptidase [Chlamydiota bacterium]MBI3276995.1 type I methionyl aminopeptidase [Chlamydiota bacterium]